jgi:class 3 adenylate cyclase/tetratricopeptide (TPR) repeat protein
VRVELTHRFCQSCGAQLPWADKNQAPPRRLLPDDHEGERRQVTVLFGDLSGFTALSQGLDPEATHELLNRYFEAVDGVIRTYGGTIDKHIGDGIMAVFGAPVAHSDDPERAMRAALDVHAKLATLQPPLTAHIGIASGTVVASGTGSDAHREYTVIGDSVNLAARLQDRAAAGETLISNAVFNAAGSRFNCISLGDVPIKGLAEPVAIWQLTDISGSGGSDDRLPFVGRRAELSQFAGMLDACWSERAGQTLLLRGEPGIGKTRLLEEYRDLARQRGFDWHRGLVLDFGAGKGLDAIATVVSGLLGISHNADAAEKSLAATRAVTSSAVDIEQQVYLNDLLNLPQPMDLRSLYDAMDNATRTTGKEELVMRLVKNVATASPIVIAVEDIHWADSATLSYLARLAGACATDPALMVMTSRVEGDPIDVAWRAASAGAPLTTVDLGPLRPDEAFSFANDYFDATERFARTCVERAGGNPLFLEQLLRGAEDVSESEIPGSVQSIVLARMDNLESDDRQALQGASVLGQRFSMDALQYLLENPEYDCRRLVEHFLVRPEGSAFLFAHALVRDGVYSSLLNRRRKALHGRAADWYASHDLALRAEHLDRAEDPGAAAAYLAAAEEEAQAYRNESALRLSERGLAIADQTVRHAVLCFRGDLLRGLGEVDKSNSAFEDALAAATENVDRSRAWIGLAECLRISDRPGDALEALDNAERTAANGPPLALAEIYHLRGNLYFPAGRFDDCLAQHEQSLGFAREAGSREWEARALGGLGDASYLTGRMRTACEHFRHCVSLCQELGLGRIEVANRHMVGWSRMYLNETAEACEDGQAAAEMAEKVGHNRAEMLARQLAGFMHIEQGQLDLGRKETERATGLARRLGANNFVAEGLCFLAKVFMLEGRLDEARQHIEEALHIIREVGITFFGPFILGNAARLAEDPSQRMSLLAEAEAILEKGCVSHNYFWFYRDAIEAALETRDWPQVERYAEALERYAHTELLPWSDLFVARGRALAQFGRGERGPELAAELDRLVTATRRARLTAHLPAIESAAKAG